MSTLKKHLSLSGLTAIVIGSCIGSGIFTTPANVVAELPHHGWVLAVWILGGFVAFIGALSFAELSAQFPKAGGVYVYLKEAYGPLVGFLYGWAILFIINTGAIAALGFALAEYMGFFFELSLVSKKVFAATVVIALTLINALGVNISQHFAKTFTGLKLLALGLIILVGLYNYPQSETNMQIFSKSNPDDLFKMLLLSFVGVFWSFGGWHHATYLSAETKNPRKTVPRAMLYGTVIVTLVYVLINFSLMSLLPLDLMAESERVAGDAIASVFSGGGKIVSVIIAISIFGTIGIYTMTAPRIYYAMAKDGIFFNGLAKLHPKYGTPVNAMLLQALWAIVLIIAWGSFYKIITFVVFMDIAFMALAGTTVFVFRKRNPRQELAYRVPLYPLVPILFVLISGAFVINTFFSLSLQCIAGLVILLIGVPVYFYFTRKVD